jgi:signal transduction histidine kinase
MERWESLLEELRAEFLLREEELELLHEIDLQLIESERPLSTTFEFIIRRTLELLGSDHMHILLRRGRSLETVYSTEKSDLGQRVDIASSLTGQALTMGTTINVADLTRSPYSSRYIPIQGYAGLPMKSLLATPVRVHDMVVGVLNAESTRTAYFKPVHEHIVGNIAAQVSVALQRSQLFDRNKLFSEVDQLIFDTGESQQVIPAVLQKVMTALQELEHIQLSGAQILFRRGETELEIVHSTNPSHVGLAVGIDESICGRAVREQRTVTIGDVSNDPEYRRLLGSSIQSEIAIPILLGDSSVAIGALNVESEEPDAFEGFYQVILNSFADKVRTLLAFAKLRSDVTEAMELRNANDLLVAVGDQASNMIHRMNNTVGAMRLRILELQDLHESGELTDDFLIDSFATLRDLATQTLQMPEDVTRLLSQQGTTVNVNEVVRTVLGRFTMPDNVVLDLELDPDMPSLSLYNFDIVVQNLVQNALDAMPGGGRLSVSTSSLIPSRLLTGYVALTVKDTGTGIPADILSRIFDLNFSTKHVKGKGLGLGLWWIRNFVLRAKGDISVTSSADRGSEFIVKFPSDPLTRSD